MKISKETIIRTVILAVTLLNQILIMLGKNPLPFAEEDIYTVLSTAGTIIASVWGFWKNNSMSVAARTSDEIMHAIQDGEITAEQALSVLNETEEN